ncbi:hypothetical protein [Mesorhizobium sp.]|uniref:hypothetical protein n=1 Tax=Mesorhizobium sp. TaxID=1871066 RepID=UPI0025BCB3F5|nr:hypothetical protein [Mesorhizobium sp.]
MRQLARTLAAMVAEHVELALFEQSLGNIEGGLKRPFGDRVAVAAEKTAGSVLFDVRVATAIPAFSGWLRSDMA